MARPSDEDDPNVEGDDVSDEEGDEDIEDYEGDEDVEGDEGDEGDEDIEGHEDIEDYEGDEDIEGDEGDEDIEGDEDVEDARLAGRSGTAAGWLDRIRSSFLPSPKSTPTARSTPTAPGKTGTSPKTAIERLDERERRLSFAAAGGSALFGVLIYVLDTNNKHFRLQKGQITPQTTLVLGIAFAALLVAATVYGRRAPVGFVALFVFLMFGTTSFFLGAPFLALAAWLLYRSYKIQKESAATARAARLEQSTSPASTTRPRSATNKSSRSASKSSRSKGPAMPEGNKRYTPKRPPPPAPKPSRRERKAARSSD
jgi:hypothetical protein